MLLRQARHSTNPRAVRRAAKQKLGAPPFGLKRAKLGARSAQYLSGPGSACVCVCAAFALGWFELVIVVWYTHMRYEVGNSQPTYLHTNSVLPYQCVCP